jgi:hypothetical protein
LIYGIEQSLCKSSLREYEAAGALLILAYMYNPKKPSLFNRFSDFGDRSAGTAFHDLLLGRVEGCQLMHMGRC